MFTHGLTGLRLREDGVRLDPTLPPQLHEGVTLKGLRFRDAVYEVGIGPRNTTVRLTSGHPVHGPHHGGAAPPRHHADPAHPSPGPDPDGRHGALPPGDGDLRVPGPVRGGGGGREPGDVLVPEGAAGSLTVDLGPRPLRITAVTPRWSDVPPASHTLETSVDGRFWRPFLTGDTARKVRVTVRSQDPEKPAGVAELRVAADES